MTEFEVRDDKLLIVCDHNWGEWRYDNPSIGSISLDVSVMSFDAYRKCSKCSMTSILVPRK